MNKPGRALAPYGGWLLDAYRKLLEIPFNPHSLTKLAVIRAHYRRHRALEVIEIGTFRGVTTRRLARFANRVVSVEIDADLHAQAKETCRGKENVELVLGDGGAELPAIVAASERAVLFLDGHFSGTGTGMGDEPEPVLAELDGIVGQLDRVVAIVIDDFRLFGRERDWPTKAQLFEKIESVFDARQWMVGVQSDMIVISRFPI